MASTLTPKLGAAADSNDTRTGPASGASEFMRVPFGRGQQEVGFALGHGLGVIVRDSRAEDLNELQFVSVRPRWGIGVTDVVGGDAWYRGNLELLAEGELLFKFDPRGGYSAGMAFIIRYNLLDTGRFVPFIEGGTGVVHLDFDLDEQRDGFNFAPQGGVGFHYFLSERTAITAGWRFHHIWNSELRHPNSGIDDSLVLVGISVFPDW